MTGKRVSVKIQPKKGSEEAFFAERDQRKLRGWRAPGRGKRGGYRLIYFVRRHPDSYSQSNSHGD